MLILPKCQKQKNVVELNLELDPHCSFSFLPCSIRCKRVQTVGVLKDKLLITGIEIDLT